MGTKRRRNSGVTQFELLISLAIMSMIGVLLTNVLSFHQRALDQQARALLKSDQLQTRNLLIAYLESIPNRFSGETANAFFAGNTSELNFKTIVNDGEWWPGEPVAVRIRENDTGIEMRLSGRDWDQNKLSRSLVLARGYSLRITFYGRKSDNPEPAWTSDWQDPQRYPDLVKLVWTSEQRATIPIAVRPARLADQSLISLSSRVPPG